MSTQPNEHTASNVEYASNEVNGNNNDITEANANIDQDNSEQCEIEECEESINNTLKRFKIQPNSKTKHDIWIFLHENKEKIKKTYF